MTNIASESNRDSTLYLMHSLILPAVLKCIKYLILFAVCVRCGGHSDWKTVQRILYGCTG